MNVFKRVKYGILGVWALCLGLLLCISFLKEQLHSTTYNLLPSSLYPSFPALCFPFHLLDHLACHPSA